MVINHICKQCGSKFQVVQGSRRHLCARCLVERIGKKSNPSKKVAVGESRE